MTWSFSRNCWSAFLSERVGKVARGMAHSIAGAGLLSKVKREGGEYEGFHTVMSTLSYLIKAPLVPPGTPVINALFAQRSCIINIFRACLGLAPENYMMMEHKLPSMLNERIAAQAAAHADASGPARKRVKQI